MWRRISTIRGVTAINTWQTGSNNAATRPGIVVIITRPPPLVIKYQCSQVCYILNRISSFLNTKIASRVCTAAK